MQTQPTTLSRRQLLTLIALCLFAFFWRLGSVGLFDLDEGLYVSAARQMARTGNVITPTLNSGSPVDPNRPGIPFYEKPILVYWVSALTMKLFGFNELAARLPAALSALAVTVLIATTGARWFGSRAGMLAGVIYALSPMTIIDARQMTTDGLVVLWIAGALFAFHRASEDRNSSAWISFWLSCALAVLTKGAIGLLLPCLIIAVSLFRQQGWRERLLALRPVPGILLFLAITAPWHILIWRAGGIDGMGRTWVQEYVMRQHIGRFRGGDVVHNAPIFTYILYFLLGMFPWSCLAPAALVTLTPRGRGKQRPYIPHAGQGEDIRGAGGSTLNAQRSTLLFCWFSTVFIFFSLGAAKLPTYIAPAYPAAALLIGKYLSEQWDRAERPGMAPRIAALAVTAVGVLIVAAALLGPRLIPADSPVPPETVTLVEITGAIVTVAGMAAWIALLRTAKRITAYSTAVYAFSAIGVTLVGLGVTWGYNLAERDITGPPQRLARDANADALRGTPVLFYHLLPHRPSLLFYAEYRPVEDRDLPLSYYLKARTFANAPEIDVLTSIQVYDGDLRRQIATLPNVSIRILKREGTTGGGWVLARIRRDAGPQKSAGRESGS